jgi:hypothetical protein
MIKIEIQNKFDIWLKGEIEKKDQFNKRLKKQNQKNEDQIENNNTLYTLIEERNWKLINFNKRVKEKKLKIKRIKTKLKK